MGEILLTKGGYGGGYDEELFKSFTIPHMEYWWFFREILRASHLSSPYWKSIDGSPLPEESKKELVAISMLNYAVHTGVAEALIYYDQMQAELTSLTSPMRGFEVRRLWKACYSSLHTSFNALCNIVYVLVSQKPVSYVNKRGEIWNYGPTEAVGLVEGRGVNNLAEPLKRCHARLAIRDHLEHYWTIWVSVRYRQFFRDKNFTKGYIVTDPSEVEYTEDAFQTANGDIVGVAEDFNLIYKELTIEKSGFFDQYLLSKDWMIDYSDFGEPHFGKRPSPQGNY